MTTLAPDFQSWVDEARAVTVTDVLAKRGVMLRRAGRERVGPCPVCGGNDRFGAHPDKNLWHCRGSGRGGDAIALVEYLDGADFIGACVTLTGREPPRGGAGSHMSAEELAARDAARQAREVEQARKSAYHREKERADLYRMWRRTQPLAGTAAEAYLALRGIPLPPSPALRFAADLPYYHGTAEDERGARRARVLHRGPALVAALTDDAGYFAGLHMTWIDLTRPKGKVALRDPETGADLPAKKVRGSKQGAAIVVLPAGSGVPRRVYSGEGIETLLSVWAAGLLLDTDFRETAFVCAADLGNLAGGAIETVPHPTAIAIDSRGARHRVKVPGPDPDFSSRAMPVPAACTGLVLLADGDSERFLTEMAMARAERRHACEGRRVRTAWAPEGRDFNDLLMASASAGEAA